MSNDNTRFVLSPGIYKITLSALFSSIDTGVTETYAVILFRNGADDNYFDYHGTEISQESTYHYFSSSLYVEGNGVDYFEINCLSNTGDYFIPSNDKYNQLSIEFVK